MNRRQFIGAAAVGVAGLTARASFLTAAVAQDVVSRVRSKGGTEIFTECAGAGPRLILVHGGASDHSRWQPLFPLFTPRFRVCAMDRRGHGASGDSPNYALQHEAEDVAAVADAEAQPAFILGHSYGAICALEAAFLSRRIARLVLYEPPIQIGEKFIDDAAVSKLEEMIRAGDREAALVQFLQKIVQISPDEIASMKTKPYWPKRVATIDASIRELRATDSYRFDAARMHKLNIATLLLTGSETAQHHKEAVHALESALPNAKVFVFQGQQHNAMDNVPEQFARVVASFLLGDGRIS